MKRSPSPQNFIIPWTRVCVQFLGAGAAVGGGQVAGPGKGRSSLPGCGLAAGAAGWSSVGAWRGQQPRRPAALSCLCRGRLPEATVLRISYSGGRLRVAARGPPAPAVSSPSQLSGRLRSEADCVSVRARALRPRQARRAEGLEGVGKKEAPGCRPEPRNGGGWMERVAGETAKAEPKAGGDWLPRFCGIA